MLLRATAAAAVALFVLLALGACAGRASSAAAAPGPAEGFLPGADGVRLHYRVLGRGAETVVAVHGGPGAGIQSLLPELEPLAERYRVVFYDQRGGGLSDLPTDTDLLGARQHVADLEAVRRFFGLERMRVIALSFGALVVARYAEEHPERLERIVFFGAVGPRRAEAADLARATPADGDPLKRERSMALLRSLTGGASSDPVADCREYEALGRELAIARGESGAWKGTACAMPPEALLYYFQHTARVGPQSFGDWDFTGSLGHLEAPLLVIHGALDAGGVELQRAWIEAVPNGRLLLIPGGGKGVSADRPELFFPAVETFLAGEWPPATEPGGVDEGGRGSVDPGKEAP
ncbi:MAG TPA: alpha/beta hydrolase [Thermoanaerobaculia bacterium]|nr:alpha/beta hydrolase [Thermoanaerobaculia bacterium]